MLRVLLDYDDRLVQLETRQRTIIHVAVTANQPESVKMLLERGADSNARDFRGRTPLALLSSVNKFGTFFNNGINGDMMGKTWQLRPQMFNPEHWDEIHRLLRGYGGEEPDDYVETVGERKMMEAVASYMYWLDHLGTAFLRNPVVSKILQDIASGTTPMEPTALYGLAAKHVVEHKSIITGFLRSMHTLAKVTEHLPAGSAVLNVSFSAQFKEYLAAWRKPVDWVECIDFMIGVLRYMQDPKEPQSPFPEGLTDADLDSIMDENGNPLRTTGPVDPISLRIFEHVLNISIPADYDAAIECLLSPFVPELPPGSLLPDESHEAFDKIKSFLKSFREDFSVHDIAAFHNQLTQALPPAGAHRTTGGAERLPDAMSTDSDFNTVNYKPSFLSDLEPPSPIYICSLNTEPPVLRKALFGSAVCFVLLLMFFLLWRMFAWLHWLNISRFTSLLLLYSLHQLLFVFPKILTDFSSFAVMALVGGWLANDRLWQFVLEYSFTRSLLEYNLFNDPYKALIRQVSFRWRYGFPEVEPLILSPAQGKEWKYDFAQLLEGLGGSHSLLSTWKGWIQRPDAISAVLDEWQRETVEGRESTVKCWGNGWWYYTEATNGNQVDTTREKHEPSTEKSGTWRKFNFVGSPKPERYLKIYGNIEVRFPPSSIYMPFGTYWLNGGFPLGGLENFPFQRAAGALSAISNSLPPNRVRRELSGNREGFC